MDNYQFSIVGGIIFGMLPNLPIEDIVVTIFMAAFGTLSSFAVSLLLRWISKRLKRPN